MSYKIFLTNKFEKELKRLIKKFPSIKHEFATIIDTLIINPQTGTYIGNNCYKIRLSIASKGKGKSGGARIISYVFIEATTVYLLSIYDKSEKENIHISDIKDLIENLDLN